MTALPPESDFTGSTRTNAQMRTTFADLRSYLAGLLGDTGDVPTALATLGALAAAGHVTRTSATTLTEADRGRVITATSGSWTLTLPGAASAGAGWAAILRNTGSGTVTIARAGSDLIDGVTSLALTGGTAVLVMSTGTAWMTAGLGGALGGPLRIAAGTTALPGLAFGGDPDTGLTNPAANQIGAVTNGVQRLLLTTAAFQVDLPITGTAVTQSATDTTAGRVMRVGDFGVGTIGNAALLANLDATDTAAGDYQTTNVGSTGTFPAGANVFGTLRVSRPTANSFQQEYAEVLSPRRWRRSYRSASTPQWSPWRLMYDQSSILGTVSQDSGVPTGALMQPGSGGQGRFRRTADGEMTCRHKITTSTSAGVVWTYPSAFVEEPVVTGTAIATEAVIVMLDAAPGTTTVTVSAWSRATGLRVAVPVCITAEGRWSTMS